MRIFICDYMCNIVFTITGQYVSKLESNLKHLSTVRDTIRSLLTQQCESMSTATDSCRISQKPLQLSALGLSGPPAAGGGGCRQRLNATSTELCLARDILRPYP